MCGHGHNRDGTGRRVAFELLREREAVLAWKLNVHEDQVRSLGLQMVTRLLRIAGHHHAVAVSLEHSHGEHLIGLVVLHDEDELRAHFVAAGLPLVFSTTCCRSPSRSAAPSEPRLRIVDTWPLRCLLSASVRCRAVRIMIGVCDVLGSARSASTTSNPVTSGIIRSRSTRSGALAFASSIASRPPDASMTSNPAGSSSTTMTLVGAPSTAVFSLSRLSRSTSSFPSTGLTK